MLFLVLALSGQSETGQIRVEVKDSTGAAVSALGFVENLATGYRRSFKTDEQGAFTIGDLPFGAYQLRVSKEGFATYSETVEVTPATVIAAVRLNIGVAAYAVSVVSATPLAGLNVPLAEIAAPTQTATNGDIEASGAIDLSSFLNRRFNNVYLNEIQGNPMQADLNYRGYTASPLLGTPQGISIYMDGVRLNQAFGDVVS